MYTYTLYLSGLETTTATLYPWSKFHKIEKKEEKANFHESLVYSTVAKHEEG